MGEETSTKPFTGLVEEYWPNRKDKRDRACIPLQNLSSSTDSTMNKLNIAGKYKFLSFKNIK